MNVVRVINFKHTVPARSIRPAEFLGFLELRGIDLGLTIADCLEPEAFGHRQTAINVGTILRIHGTDGHCWATVTGITPLGNIVIELDHDPRAVQQTQPDEAREKRLAQLAAARAARHSNKES